ncbi:fibrillin-2-like [Anneissia japonica]|uniref:fibrillin-2-like n=1 Tax=Anneissia japonica TaxID=1529436 RepID=UPI001425B44E|nr:fibrillin-2-like [Anneissia japonica]
MKDRLLLVGVVGLVAVLFDITASQGEQQQKSVIYGPNVCGPRQYAYCCPGWRLHHSVNQCIIPICSRSCNGGFCASPNACMCQRGVLGSGACINGGSTNVCEPECLNGGRCVSNNQCSCTYGFTGNRCETDYRTGPCYRTYIGPGQCSDLLSNLRCTKALCCATIGTGWGVPCQQCPTDLVCDIGFIMDRESQQCVDVNECQVIPNLCLDGKCTNTIGSYTCQCVVGFKYNMLTNRCEDINECREQTGLCQNGECINTQGTFRCICRNGYILNPNGDQCIAARLDYCYERSDGERHCSNPLLIRYSIYDCCCFQNGQGWGQQNDCTSCPLIGTLAYQSLCVAEVSRGGPGGDGTPGTPGRPGEPGTPGTPGGPGGPGGPASSATRPPIEIMQICARFNGICQNGRCIDLPNGSYQCICDAGYELSGNMCVDINECLETRYCSNGVCHNSPGDYYCTCDSGYEPLLNNRKACRDRDECKENPDICLNGKCLNMPGSYTCQCAEGYILSNDRRFCIDVDECEKTGMCRNGHCVNMAGSYKCICDKGFRNTHGVCQDIDECAEQVSLCQGGRCINSPGSYRCLCTNGFTEQPDGTCHETRRDYCYHHTAERQCAVRSQVQITRSHCCCSVIVVERGGGWGMSCETCPLQNTPEFNELCIHGRGRDNTGRNVNECMLFGNMCLHGVCEDGQGMYQCRCNDGYQIDTFGRICQDIDECAENRLLCERGICRNTPGSYVCECPAGYKFDSASVICIDINECEENNPCVNAICVNTAGSSRCECRLPGLELDEAGIACLDRRLGTCWTQIRDGRCEENIMGVMRRDECCSSFGRAWGSPCEPCPAEQVQQCQRGFIYENGKCIDINECELDMMACTNGECENSIGSFRCICSEGLSLDTGGRNCIDLRSYECYLDYVEGQCLQHIDGLYRNSVCCCSIGAAWGSLSACTPCPVPGTADYDLLCPKGSGFGDTRIRSDLMDGSVVIVDINECSVFEGMCADGICENSIGSFYCECDQGYALDEYDYSCFDINECTLMGNVCGNGTCINRPGAFICDCFEGFEGVMMDQMCVDIDECVVNYDMCSGGTCNNLMGSFECICPQGQQLTSDGQACKDIDECTTTHGICTNGRCHNILGSYRCLCNPGFKPTANFKACQDMYECDMNNGGCDHTCKNMMGSFVCECKPGYILLPDGVTCIDVDECIEDMDICGGGTCTNIQGSYSCICFTGFRASGDHKNCLDINECDLNPTICLDGRCENTRGSYMCHCELGYSVKPGRVGCIDMNECEMGVHNCAMNSECINTKGTFMCSCKPGFEGNGISCVDIDECDRQIDECHLNALCVNMPGTYQCRCQAGFTGDGRSCQDIDECSRNLNLCSNGQCLNTPGAYECDCETGFFVSVARDRCEDINECTDFPEICTYGQCVNVPGMFRCECFDGFEKDQTGGNCTDIDECRDLNLCQSGICINTWGSFQCDCPPFFSLTLSNTACVDLRIGKCYAMYSEDGRGDTADSQCYGLLDVSAARASCCCSIGKAWGDPCEPCPKVNTTDYNLLCPGGPGFRPSKFTDVVGDIDECVELGDICEGGKCVNTFGSYRCDCPSGLRYDEQMKICRDINECVEYPNACSPGFCRNNIGNYTCSCPFEYELQFNDKGNAYCLDVRERFCFRTKNSTNHCTNPLDSVLTKMTCCCTSVGAVGWGLDCESCPSYGSEPYAQLCGTEPMDPMQMCKMIGDICENGNCIPVNNMMGFRCDCFIGYRYDDMALKCRDIDECLENTHRCRGNAECVNTPGEYECACPVGFELADERSCIDKDECAINPNECLNGACSNTVGSFECLCHQGFSPTSDGKDCVDTDECSLGACGINGTCINEFGSFICNCFVGFRQSHNKDCIDVNECLELGVVCNNGFCTNTPGSFVCQCQIGFRVSPDQRNCEDRNECVEQPGICVNGRCENIFGSFRCICDPGYILASNGFECVDQNECDLIPGICYDGICRNTEGHFQCMCPAGFLLTLDGTKCVDLRQSYCMVNVVNGVCTDPLLVNVTKRECCCAFGAGWGSPCIPCPSEADPDFLNLCPNGKGYANVRNPDVYEDINECKVFAEICNNGRCINMDGSFRCECDQGYQLDESKRNCVDIDDCAENGNICGFNSTCVNQAGGFQCYCGPGFQPGYNGICEDINECHRNRNYCAFRCKNLPGSFECMCPRGYTLKPDGKSCEDLDECITSANNCRFDCKNLIGTFRCVCPPGLRAVTRRGDVCVDIDECRTQRNLCFNGRCMNTEGSYRCDCNNGYVTSQSGIECLDNRVGTCYVSLPRGVCETPLNLLTPVTLDTCCCAGGKAWGQACEHCPMFGSTPYMKMCTCGVGYNRDCQDVNECQVLPNICENGRCLNTQGSFQCQCNIGYILHPDGTHCVDEDECKRPQSPCPFQCTNTIGSYSCDCHIGFQLSSDGATCVDIDECAYGQHTCQYQCINTQGSYMCSCPEGYSQTGITCTDIDECTTNPQACGPNGVCHNMQGSFRCDCKRGFRLDDTGTQCLDLDECSIQGRCQYDCENSVGGYHCTCPRGYIPYAYGSNCRDENECLTPGTCGTAQCYNTEGSFTCNCNTGFEYDQFQGGCQDVNECDRLSPCSYGCDNIQGSFSCGCPPGYITVAQGACVSTFGLESKPCYSCQYSTGRRRRAVDDDEAPDEGSEVDHGVYDVDKNTGILQINLTLAKAHPKVRIMKLVTAYSKKIGLMHYKLTNGQDNFTIQKKDGGVAILRVKNEIKEPSVFHLQVKGSVAPKDEKVMEVDLLAEKMHQIMILDIDLNVIEDTV